MEEVIQRITDEIIKDIQKQIPGIISNIIKEEMNTKKTSPENDKKRMDFSAAVNEFEKNIGTITASVAERISAWLDDVDLSLILYAIEQAALHNKRSWIYIEGILKAKFGRGIKTRAAAESDSPKKTNNSSYELDDMAAAERKMRLERMRERSGIRK